MWERKETVSRQLHVARSCQSSISARTALPSHIGALSMDHRDQIRLAWTELVTAPRRRQPGRGRLLVPSQLYGQPLGKNSGGQV